MEEGIQAHGRGAWIPPLLQASQRSCARGFDIQGFCSKNLKFAAHFLLTDAGEVLKGSDPLKIDSRTLPWLFSHYKEGYSFLSL